MIERVNQTRRKKYRAFLIYGKGTAGKKINKIYQEEQKLRVKKQ